MSPTKHYWLQHQLINTSQFGSRVITAAASQGLVAGSLLADRQVRPEGSPAHRSAERGLPMLALLHCKHPGVCPFWHGALFVWRVVNVGRHMGQTNAGQIMD